MTSELTDSSPCLTDPAALRERLAQDSYVFLRGVLPADAVLDLRARLLALLEARGWLAPDHDPDDAVAGPSAVAENGWDPEFVAWYRQVQSMPAFHELAHHPALVGALGSVLGGAVLVHPRKIARAALPSGETAIPTPAHQDFPLIQGTVDTLTTWIPIGDCPPELGGLRVLSGSAPAGIRSTRPHGGAGGMEVQDVGPDDERWRTTSFAAGDVLLFHSLTVHAALPNVTDRVRLSVDYRFQAQGTPILEASLKPHYFPLIPDWDELTEGWTDLSSIEAPGANVVPTVDLFDPEFRLPPSRLVDAAER